MAVQLLTRALAKWAYPLLWSITATTPLNETTVICRVGTSNSTLSFASYMSGWRESKGYFLMKPSTVEPLCYNELSLYRCSQLIVLQLIRTSNLIGPLWVARSSFVVGLGSTVYFVCLLFSQPIPWGLPRDARSLNSFSYILRLLGLKKSFVTSMPLLYSSSLHRSSTQGSTCCFARPPCLNFLIILWVSPYVARRRMLRFLIEVNRWGWNFCRLVLLYDFPTSCIVFYFEQPPM